MGYLIGIVALVLVVIFFLKRDVGRFNQHSLLDFPAWLAIYNSSSPPEKIGLARAFLVQSLHMAGEMGAIGSEDKKLAESGFRREDPVEIVDQWLENSLPNVVEVIGSGNLSNVAARLVGVFMIVVNLSLKPQRDLQKFIERMG